jgi:CheY-like chemotaxis protein
VLVLRDVTAWREAQERSLQSRKLEAIGQLAGGVAHDFNNLLTSILGNAELLSDNADPSVRTAASMIAVAARRSADVTGQLLRFSHKDAEAKDTLDVHALMYEAVELLRMSLGRHIEMQLDFTAEASSVQGEAGSFQNALLNLCLNARDAILARTDTRVPGRITIATRTPLTEPKTLRIIVSDNGVGMTEEVRAQIFEPFFTTKFTGRGLGLAALMGIVRGHQGGVQIETQVGKGSCFTVYLPAALDDAVEPPVTRPPSEDTVPGVALLVDDEAEVNAMLGSMLEVFAMSVKSVPSGEEALAYLAQHGAPAVILLDMTMPGLSGVEVLRALRQTEPTLPVLLMSGYGLVGEEGAALEGPHTGFLQKPFTLESLRNALLDLLT